MKKYLNINNPIMRGLSRVADCLFLSVLWLVFSLPVITIGASSTALYTTVYRYIRRGEGYLWRTFWEAFKESFKRATGCWIIILTALVLLFFDSLVFRNMLKQGKPLGSLYWVILCFMAIVCAWAQYLFAYCSRFEGGALESVRLSFLLMAAHPLKALFVLIFVVLAIAAILIVPFLVFLLPAFVSWLSSIHIEQVFLKHMNQKDRERTLREEEEIRPEPRQPPRRRADFGINLAHYDKKPN